MEYVVYLIVIGSAIWVLVDAKNIGVKKGLITGMGNIGPWGWFFVTLLLWIVAFPMYLYCRGKFKLAIAETSNVGGSPIDNQQVRMSFEDIEKLAALKEKGIITDDEFEAKKKQLLGF